MYNLNGIELNLDNELLENYSEIICSQLNSEHFNDSLSWLGEMMFKIDSLEKAVHLYGARVVSEKIERAIKNELSIYDKNNMMGTE